jgi:hypothetical protein
VCKTSCRCSNFRSKCAMRRGPAWSELHVQAGGAGPLRAPARHGFSKLQEPVETFRCVPVIPTEHPTMQTNVAGTCHVFAPAQPLQLM